METNSSMMDLAAAQHFHLVVNFQITAAGFLEQMAKQYAEWRRLYGISRF